MISKKELRSEINKLKLQLGQATADIADLNRRLDKREKRDRVVDEANKGVTEQLEERHLL